MTISNICETLKNCYMNSFQIDEKHVQLDPADGALQLGGPHSKQPQKATMCKSTTWIVYSSHGLTFLAPWCRIVVVEMDGKW